MTIARKNIVDNEVPGFYHCLNRCVRRTFLCGIDELTGKDYSHRKDWMENRIIELSGIFAVEVFALAVMSNHYHIVTYLNPKEPQNWSPEEVADRWLNAYGSKHNNPRVAKQRELKKQAIIADKEKIALYRERLGSLSWFMSRLNEPLAKMSNNEDKVNAVGRESALGYYCTGRFWEGRFTSQALLDEAAVFSAMAYVDLNPIRAKITQRLEESHNTSIKKRLDAIKEKSPAEVQAYLDSTVMAISNNVKTKKLPMTLRSYIELVEWTGKNIIHPNKAAMPKNIQSCLSNLNLQQDHWLKQIENYGKNYCHVVGPAAMIKAKAKQLKRRWLKGVKSAKLLYE
jgi:hypothetical protein